MVTLASRKLRVEDHHVLARDKGLGDHVDEVVVGVEDFHGLVSALLRVDLHGFQHRILMDVEHEPVAGVEVVLAILEIGRGLASCCAELAVRMGGPNRAVLGEQRQGVGRSDLQGLWRVRRLEPMRAWLGRERHRLGGLHGRLGRGGVHLEARPVVDGRDLRIVARVLVRASHAEEFLPFASATHVEVEARPVVHKGGWIVIARRHVGASRVAELARQAQQEQALFHVRHRDDA